MKINKKILYFVDNEIQLYNSKQIQTIKINDKVLKNGKIANIKEFIKEFNLIIKKYNLNDALFGNKISVIVTSNYTLADKTVLKNILESLGFRNITFISELKIYKLNTSKAYLNYNNSYALLNYMDKFKETNCLLLEKQIFNVNELTKFIKRRIDKKELIIFGNNDNIEDFIKSFNKANCYYYSNAKFFLIEALLNKSLQ